MFAFLTFVYPGSDSSLPAPLRRRLRRDAIQVASKWRKQGRAKKAVEAATRIDATQKLIAKIEEFRATDNWNLLVLYTTEWTRQEPGNAAAWSQLSQGFERLRQFAEAREAATSAVKLAPKEARYWRNLGDIDIELNRQEDALKAFEVAGGLDDKDVHSVVQIGILNVALSRLPEAKVASTRALELNPDDAAALCLKGLILTSLAPPKVPERPLPASPSMTAPVAACVVRGCRDGNGGRDFRPVCQAHGCVNQTLADVAHSFAAAIRGARVPSRCHSTWRGSSSSFFVVVR